MAAAGPETSYALVVVVVQTPSSYGGGLLINRQDKSFRRGIEWVELWFLHFVMPDELLDPGEKVVAAEGHHRFDRSKMQFQLPRTCD